MCSGWKNAGIAMMSNRRDVIHVKIMFPIFLTLFYPDPMWCGWWDVKTQEVTNLTLFDPELMWCGWWDVKKPK